MFSGKIEIDIRKKKQTMKKLKQVGEFPSLEIFRTRLDKVVKLFKTCNNKNRLSGVFAKTPFFDISKP